MNEKRTDSVSIQQYLMLAEAYEVINPDSGLYFGNKSLELSKKLKWELEELQSVLAIGRNYNRQGAYDKALGLYNQILSRNASLRDSTLFANTYSAIGISYHYLGNPKKGIEYTQQSIKINEQRNNIFALSRNYNMMGNLLSAMKQYKPAISWYMKALKAAEASNNQTVISYANSNMGSSYAGLGEYRNALQFHFKALVIEEALGDIFGMSTEYVSISAAYIGLTKDSADVEAVINKHFVDSAIYYSHKATSLFIQCDDYYDLSLAYINLGRSYNMKDDYKNAFDYLNKGVTIRDSLLSDEKKNQIQEAETNQLKALHEKEIEIQQLRVLKSKREKIALVAGIALLLAGLGFILRNYRKQQAINKRLQETQQQLVQQEKLASLGALTAGIAHEIKNPLNFVNNFSDLSRELIAEIKSSIDDKERTELLDMLDANLDKIGQHGKRADSIVHNMLQHSRSGSTEKQDTDINKLCEEYLAITYHGIRAKMPEFQCEMVTQFDAHLPRIPIIAQDISRVILNLLNNAFYAVKDKQDGKVKISTLKVKDHLEIRVRDNGRGISEAVQKKIFEPFFTTKPPGEGTGLGLSLSHDIIEAHRGELRVQSAENEYTEFTISLPLSDKPPI